MSINIVSADFMLVHFYYLSRVGLRPWFLDRRSDHGYGTVAPWFRTFARLSRCERHFGAFARGLSAFASNIHRLGDAFFQVFFFGLFRHVRLWLYRNRIGYFFRCLFAFVQNVRVFPAIYATVCRYSYYVAAIWTESSGRDYAGVTKSYVCCNPFLIFPQLFLNRSKS